MDRDIHQFARLGLVHHMLHPACADDPAEHTRTLQRFAARADIETFDCCLPFDQPWRGVAAAAVRACGKAHVVFATHFLPLRQLPFSVTTPALQAQLRLLLAEQVRQAAAIGAHGFIFATGGPGPETATDAQRRACRDTVAWLCGQLDARGIVPMLEPFDTTIDKCFLHGPTADCVALIEDLAPTPLKIELDLAHLPLMGEDFATAIRTVAPYLARVHLGNCVYRDRAHPLYGDKHPPIGYPGGEIAGPELTAILRELLAVGFLNPDRRGDLLIEMTPWPGKSVEATIADQWQRLETAWAAV